MLYTDCRQRDENQLESYTFFDFFEYTYLRLVSFAYGRRWLGSIRGMIPHAISSAGALFFCKSRLRGHTKHTQEKKKTSNDSDTDATKQFLFRATGMIFVEELYYCIGRVIKRKKKKRKSFVGISRFIIWANCLFLERLDGKAVTNDF